MNQYPRRRAATFRSGKTISILSIIMITVAIATSAFDANHAPFLISSGTGENTSDSLQSLEAFNKVYQVLMSPRCMNCHPSGDVPLQGDDSHLHTMLPKRGKDGKGLYAMKCTNCHQPANTPGLHTPPGSPKWHLPPAATKMVFQGRTASQLAKQLLDPKQNGNKDIPKLIEHADDELVLAGWNPGEGRTLPPMSHAEFKEAWITWLTKGAHTPAAK